MPCPVECNGYLASPSIQNSKRSRPEKRQNSISKVRFTGPPWGCSELVFLAAKFSAWVRPAARNGGPTMRVGRMPASPALRAYANLTTWFNPDSFEFLFLSRTHLRNLRQYYFLSSFAFGVYPERIFGWIAFSTSSSAANKQSASGSENGIGGRILMTL